MKIKYKFGLYILKPCTKTVTSQVLMGLKNFGEVGG